MTDRNKPKKMFLLPPEMGDGSSRSIVPDAATVGELLTEWAANVEAGEQVTVTLVMMSEMQLECLPDL